MGELKFHGQYEKEDGKRIMRLINEIKIRGMRLARIVNESDMTIIANIIAMRLLPYAAEKQIERSAKEVEGLEDELLHGLMRIERDNALMTVEPGKFRDARVDHTDLSEDWEVVITLAREK